MKHYKRFLALSAAAAMAVSLAACGSGGSTNLLERYYNQYMQEYQMTPDNGTTTDGNTI